MTDQYHENPSAERAKPALDVFAAFSAASSPAPALDDSERAERSTDGPRLPAAALLFQAPEPAARRAPDPDDEDDEEFEDSGQDDDSEDDEDESSERDSDDSEDDADEDQRSSGGRRRRRRGGRGRRNRGGQGGEGQNEGDSGEQRTGGDNAQRDSEDASGGGGKAKDADAGKSSGQRKQSSQSKRSGQQDAQQKRDDERPDESSEDAEQNDESGEGSGSSRRRRRRRSRGNGEEDTSRETPTALKGSTRLEAKRQRRREGREAGRRRPSISESEHLARREAVARTMLVREQDGLNQIAVLEDNILVEHYVARHTQTSMVGNVYLGRVQNVLPSMEAAFVDVGKGRNAVLYAGEVNWDAAGLQGKPRRIEDALRSGDTVLVQVTKDPIGHKGARLTSQITLAGRHLVLVPSGGMTGISRKLPDNERARLKKLLKEIVPEGSGVIVRTAAEGATEEQLRQDVERLTQQWASIQEKAKNGKGAPLLLKGEPELAVRVVRDVFNEDFESLVVSGDKAWKTISGYVTDLSPDLADRMTHWTEDRDLFAAHRVDEQLAKAMSPKVWLPSGGSLIIERTEAMTVIDVNTGKFTGSGGTLEETVTKNNLEAAEEIVRQLRLRDIGGIIVIDFIDMVLETNRDLVLRRMLECLGRDRTRHQVAEVTSLGLVQMTRKRVGQGLVEAFSTTCEHCDGKGFIVHDEPVEQSKAEQDSSGGKSRRKRGKGGKDSSRTESKAAAPAEVADAQDVAAREQVKATLATIAAAAASAHQDDAKSEQRPAAQKPEQAETGSTARAEDREPSATQAEGQPAPGGAGGRATADAGSERKSPAKRSGAGRRSGAAQKAAAGQGTEPESPEQSSSSESQPGQVAPPEKAPETAVAPAAPKQSRPRRARAKTTTVPEVSAPIELPEPVLQQEPASAPKTSDESQATAAPARRPRRRAVSRGVGAPEGGSSGIMTVPAEDAGS